MYVTSVSINDTAAGADETYTGRQVSTGLVEDLIRRLDGTRHTTVTLNAGDGASMAIGGRAIGGRAGEGLVVYQTRDSAYQVLSGTSIVSLAAGNQRDRGNLVDVERAVKAAREFALAGKLAADLVWQRF